MASTFQKLNLKDQGRIVVWNAPASFEPEIATLHGVAVKRDLRHGGAIEFALAFVMTQKELDQVAPAVAKKAQGDAVVWFAYPKGSSKEVQIGTEPRFRRVEDSGPVGIRAGAAGGD